METSNVDVNEKPTTYSLLGTTERISEIIKQAWAKRNPNHPVVRVTPTSYTHYDMPTEYMVEYTYLGQTKFEFFDSFRALRFIADSIEGVRI
jgi:hypothetical protein